MALLNRCVFTPTTTGLADFSGWSAVFGYMTPEQAGAVNATTYSYTAQSADLSQWEIGTGTFQSSVVWSVDTANQVAVRNTNTGVPNVVVSKPASTSSGDFLIIMIVQLLSGGASDPGTWTPPAGWNPAVQFYNASIFTAMRYAIFTRTVGLSDPSSYTFIAPDNTASYSYTIVRITTGGPISVDKVSAWTGDGSTGLGDTITFPQLTGLGGSDLAIASICQRSGTTDSFSGGLTTGLATGSLGSNYGFQSLSSSSSGAAYQYTATGITDPVFGVVALSTILPSLFKRTTIRYSSTSGSKINFTNPPTVFISPIAGVDI